MKRGLIDFVKENPYVESDPFSEPPETEEERLSQRIKEGIEHAEPFRGVLEDCLSLIGILARNQAWADDLKAKLKRVEPVEDDLDFLG